MAKKTKSYSQVQATDALEHLGQHGTSASEFIYDLLRIFAGYGDGQIRRTKDGPGNLAKDGETVLIKNLVAYREAVVNTLDGDCSKMYDVINAMRDDAKIAKHSPRLYITSNGVFVVAYDPKENDWYENRIDLLWKDFEFFTPLAGIEKIQFTAEAEVDVKSAELMAKLFDDIRRYNDIRDPQIVHALNVFMSRLLFCFFAEDTGLFPEDNLFTNTLRTHTKEDGSDLAEFIDRVFMAMATAPSGDGRDLSRPYSAFPYVNGGLFRDRYPIPVLSRRARTLIINCGEYNWREINPDIFGSMIQAVVTPEHRAGLGMHYTSVPNIEKVIRPLFLDALEEEFEAACAEVREKMSKKANHDRASQRLRNLLNRLSNIKFFDPACGSGNFLIITYKRLRELEIRIWKAMREITGMALLPFPNITLTQFYGIELDEYAAETATLSMWLAEHQMNVKFQEELFVLPETLPLKPSGHIVCGNACRLDWNTICPHTPEDEVYIMGNPPYLGSKLQDAIQKDDMKAALSDVKDKKGVDYIAAWFWKGAKYIKESKAKYAFVTTNSISQGEQVAMLWKPIFDLGLEIFYARTSFKWSNNAKYNAAVTVAIIGVGNKNNTQKLLFNEQENKAYKVDTINPYLSAADNVIVAKTYNIPQGLPKAEFGCMPYDNGHLLLSESEKNSLLEKYPKSDIFIKRIMGSQEFLNDIRRYCLWIDDDKREEAENIPPLRERIAATKDFRLNESKDGASLANRSHQFREHYVINGDSKGKVIIPSVSSERRIYIPIGYVDKDTVISNLAFAVYGAEKWLFALLTSKMHNLWVRTVGGRLKTDYRYSATLCYNTFPFPKLTTADKEELERLAQNILNIRDENFDMTLGEMYNPESMPEELREAHHQLDLAVERIYRPEPFTSDEERLEHLFKLYAKMTKK
ncbi:class I SAM-dependent DNA methyltransferase [Muribaculaceae bacterium Isolate-001 (NCI)]|nr:class I SAM-dependent DNA methyltransferase [Muribaculaceae bacterium Isolate-001 (NCI)]